MKILSGCVIINDDKILLLHKLKHDYYELPGGKVKNGESLETTAIRETKEEIDCDVSIERKWGSYEFMRNNEKIQSNIYLAKIINGTPKVMEPELFSKEILWMPINDYKKYKLAPNVEYFCQRNMF